jgi:hypothetical protein
VENLAPSRLLKTRQGTIVVGVAAAVLAAILLLVYLSHYRSSVKGSTEPVTVLVAQSLIPKGTSGSIDRPAEPLRRDHDPEGTGQRRGNQRSGGAAGNGRGDGHLSKPPADV